MKTADAIAYFSESEDGRGAKIRIARALGLTSGAVSQWGDVVPEKQAYRLEDITGGSLKIDKTLYEQPGDR